MKTGFMDFFKFVILLNTKKSKLPTSNLDMDK